MPTTSDFPALPQITGDLILETFSHKSLKLDYDPEISTDNERLIELGKTMLQFTATRYLYGKKPIVPASDIPALRDEILSSENYETWVAHYNLRQRLRYIHTDTFDVMNPEETRNLFQAYVGAVAWQSGPVITTNWITRLINPEAVILSTAEVHQETEDHRVNKRLRAEPVPPEAPPPPIPAGPLAAAAAATPIPVHYGAAQATNTSTAATENPAIGPQAVPNKTAPKPLGFLPIFNERCAQQHLQVEYQAANHAAPHAPLWVIKCFVNGIQKGEGQGTSKQIAKEAAAKEAYYAMGWAAYGQLS